MLNVERTFGSLAPPACGACAEPAARALTWAVYCVFLFFLLWSFRDTKACSGIAGTRFFCLSLSLACDLPAPFTGQVAVEDLPRPRCTPSLRARAATQELIGSCLR